MQEYVRNLFNSDPSIPRQIEDYLKAKTLAEERRAKQSAPLEEKDYYDYEEKEDKLRQ
jgi:hypothetical protein